MESEEIQVVSGSEVVTELTDQLERFCRGRGDGLVNVFVLHATAGVALMETGSGSEADLAQAIEGLLPTTGPYRHRHGSEGHGRDHVVPCFISPSVSIPVADGRPLLGIWQRLVLVDTNRDNPRRKVRFSFLAG
ncbi:MAG: YjbQ family protein [Acidimicrobiales bacterium]